ncbi:MAG: DnaJ domain-containing protein, partial [Desulfobulbaceae bacterium]|nr:DnaJ domain-containing protein [Desulfobulbaceae bacterium]
FYALLHAILAANPEGIAEHELLAALKREGVPLFAENDRHDPLEIFQHHFLLFHLLYGLRDRLRSQRRGDIAIHCLKIVLLPPPAATDGIVPEVFEPLRAYYLDLGQLRGVARSDVEAMLERFWALYAGHERRDRALAVFGLQADAGREEVKRRYRQLAREHHPDRGGDPERFRRVREAAEDLLGR